MRRFFTTITAFVIMTSAAMAATATATSENGGNIAANAIDGNAGTRWESVSTDGDDITLTINYEEQKTFDTFRILWEGAWAKDFILQGSNDGENFDDLKTVHYDAIPSPLNQIYSLDKQVTYQYVRFKGIERGTGYGYSFFELETYVTVADVLTKFTISMPSLSKINTAITATVKAYNQYDTEMEAEHTITVSPADMATVNGDIITFTANGKATVTVSNEDGTVTASANTVVYAGENLALSTNITSDNKVIAQSDFAPSGTDAFHAVDTNEGSVWQGSATNGTDGDEESRTYDAWFILDLGKGCDIELITINFEGACSQEYFIDFATSYDPENPDATVWISGYSYVGTAGINGHTDYIYKGGAMDLANATNKRYVRFMSVKAATAYGMKIFDMKVIGTESKSSASGNIKADAVAPKVYKAFENGRIVIYNNGNKYDLLGNPIK